MRTYDQTNMAIIAANRFGYGLRAGDDLAPEQAKIWLKQGLMAPMFDKQLPSTTNMMATIAKNRMEKRRLKDDAQQLDSDKKRYPRQQHLAFLEHQFNSLIHAEHTIQWRLLAFFANHFSVTAQNDLMWVLAPALERDAIAPNLLGTFEALLLAVIKHPAMLIYLNNERSFGPNSKLGRRGKGMNENLAREILELHTLGVDGGYSQTDVIELAKAITGWSVANPVKENSAGFRFRDKGHEPGQRQLLGATYRQTGQSQGEAMLTTLARHPATRHHLCVKLARHFIADEPSEILVREMEEAWLQSGGAIKQVMLALIDSAESWKPARQKFKTPHEFVFSSLRLLQPPTIATKRLASALKQLGQQPHKAGSPAGYPDTEADWLGAKALMTRIDWATLAAGRYRRNADELMQTALADSASERTYNKVIRAESRAQATTLLLLSPEFQRR
ncbi:hypothetical protein GCM10011369_11070 [Neiella marina]|uniref:DUF1800 domain-containing protein n=1 Tax=Neiella marina TaxID=508461 RepID=A0A8J2U3F4_9GAMM|nr:DUF1800 domain-containing protein [Neiella marina]GGA71114.1 hypothetical protein GCM10011369_11070 [Neiella marina]